MDGSSILGLIEHMIRLEAASGVPHVRYREPLIACVSADDPGMRSLPETAHPDHMVPTDLLPGGRSVVSFFLPFDREIVESNLVSRTDVSREWVVAYLETNRLINRICSRLVRELAGIGVHAAAEPPTDNFDHTTLTSRWSHKSVAVASGLGSFGLHQMVITDAGCAGRFGSLVLDAELPCGPKTARVRCLHFSGKECRACVDQCPVNALSTEQAMDRERCWKRCLGVARRFTELGRAEVCGKCATGPCALRSPV